MTAYELRISDWSSDVCSSELALNLAHAEDFRRISAGQDSLAAGFQFFFEWPPDRFIQLPLHQCRHQVKDRYGHASQCKAMGSLQAKQAPTDDQIGRASCRERVCQYV